MAERSRECSGRYCGETEKERERQADRWREEEGEKTRGDFWLGVVVVREGFILLVTLELDQK